MKRAPHIVNVEELPSTVFNNDRSFDTLVHVAKSVKGGKPVKISYMSRSGVERVLKITSKNRYHQIIFQALAAGFASAWYTDLAEISKHVQRELLRMFFQWLNTHDSQRTDSARYECLNDYIQYRRNEQGVKNGKLGTIKNLISSGLGSPFLSKEDIIYLNTLLRLSNEQWDIETESYTLTKWFGIPWLREILGEKKFLYLESPRRLIQSFRVTVAVTLLYLLKCRQEWKSRQPISEFTCDSPSKRTIQLRRSSWLLRNMGRFKPNGKPADSLTELLLTDVVSPTVLKLLLERNSTPEEWLNLTKKYLLQDGKHIQIWRSATLFQPGYEDQYSRLEERLAAWLCACETIQPHDVVKLKSTDYAIEYNENGRLLFLQCQYYKGRSGSFKETAMLTASDCWTHAIFQYLNGLKCPGPLFKTKINSWIHTPAFYSEMQHSHLHILGDIWKAPEVITQLEREYNRSQCTPIFLEAMLAFQYATPSNAVRRSEIPTTEIQNSQRRLPSSIFKLAHIKTSAVHAESDRYRDSDLINHHSHSSETEKHSYLTDANKDWVNQCGRITRLVIHDLQNVVYQPSVEQIRHAVRELDLRTRVIKATGASNGGIKTLKSIPFDTEELDKDDIIVADTIDSALYFIHYITQAESALTQLLRVRPDFVERTLITQVEWMSRILTKMHSSKAAHAVYIRVRDHLPPLFDHVIGSSE